MRFIAIDIESNQPSNKIIQIGAAAFDTDSKDPHVPKEEFNMFIDPGEDVNWDHVLRGGTTTLGKLLGPDFKMSWESLKQPPEYVFQQFWDWVKEIEHSKKIVQWGGWDLDLVIKQGKELGVRYPSSVKEIDLKRIFQFLYIPGMRFPNKAGGLSNCCANMGIKFEGRAHDGLVDAINTGHLAVKMYEVIRNYSDIKDITIKGE